MHIFLRNFFFFILQPGVVCGVIPWIIAKREWQKILQQTWTISQYAGVVVLLTGLSVVIYCVYLFGKVGRGTLSPADPTRRLVTVGVYRYSRNPMYLGVAAILIGQTLMTLSTGMVVYTLLVLALFQVYISGFEEPRLRRDFGTEYENYSALVNRWVGRKGR